MAKKSCFSVGLGLIPRWIPCTIWVEGEMHPVGHPLEVENPHIFNVEGSKNRFFDLPTLKIWWFFALRGQKMSLRGHEMTFFDPWGSRNDIFWPLRVTKWHFPGPNLLGSRNHEKSRKSWKCRKKSLFFQYFSIFFVSSNNLCHLSRISHTKKILPRILLSSGNNYFQAVSCSRTIEIWFSMGEEIII